MLMSTMDFVAYLRRDRGLDITKSKLDSLIARGLVAKPEMVGTSRVWMEGDADAVVEAALAARKKGAE